MKPVHRKTPRRLRFPALALLACLTCGAGFAPAVGAEPIEERSAARDRSLSAARGATRTARVTPRPEPRAVPQLLEDAEAAYRDARWQVALDAFKAVVALQPDHAQGWLRIGNVHQRRDQWLAAAAAYRKAADVAQRAPSDATLRTRALLNLASVNLELAEAALSQAGPVSDAEGVEVTRRAVQVSEALQSAFTTEAAASARNTPPVVEYLRPPARP